MSTGTKVLKYWFLGGSAANLERQLSYTPFFSLFPPERREGLLLLPLLSPQRLLRFSSRTKIDKSNSACCLFVQALPLSLSLSVYFFAQSSFSSGAGILFLRVARREWSDAIRFEKILRENNRGVGSRRRGGVDEKQYFNRAREGAASSPRTRTPPLPANNNNKRCIPGERFACR